MRAQPKSLTTFLIGPLRKVYPMVFRVREGLRLYRMAADFRTAQPVEYYRTFLEQDVRPDGRELGEIRSTTLNIGSINTAEGSALVKLGNTTILCGIKAELAAPKEGEGNKGFVVPNVDLPPLCSPKFRPGPPSEQAQVASQFMENVIINSKCIAPESLCVVEGKLVWVLYCDLMCMDYDGNLLDTCILALLAALKNVLLPKVSLVEETGLPEADFKEKLPLNILSQPVATSFGIFDNRIVFADPTDEEETLATGAVTVVTLDDGSLCTVHKPGGSSLTDKQLEECIDRAQTRGKEVRRLIDETLQTVER